jgi:hypothetical protein
MNRLCCPSCQLRFARSAAAYLGACPGCGLPPVPVDDPAILVGMRLFKPMDLPHTMPDAVAVALPEPTPDGGWW